MFYELYQALFSSIDGNEAKRQGISNDDSPAAHDARKAPQSRKSVTTDIDCDIKNLEAAFFGGNPIETGFCIDVTLRDLLSICPRRRRRRDSYRGLIKKLGKMGVELRIK